MSACLPTKPKFPFSDHPSLISLPHHTFRSHFSLPEMPIASAPSHKSAPPRPRLGSRQHRPSGRITAATHHTSVVLEVEENTIKSFPRLGLSDDDGRVDLFPQLGLPLLDG